eukprot:gene18679-biopygen2439
MVQTPPVHVNTASVPICTCLKCTGGKGGRPAPHSQCAAPPDWFPGYVSQRRARSTGRCRRAYGVAGAPRGAASAPRGHSPPASSRDS